MTTLFPFVLNQSIITIRMCSSKATTWWKTNEPSGRGQYTYRVYTL